MRIGKTQIGDEYPAYFIADIGANHDGNLKRAKELVKLAALNGANAAKFQHFSAPKIVSEKGFDELGQRIAHQASWTRSVIEIYKDASIPWEWTEELSETAKEFGIDFFTSPYDLDAIDFVNNFVTAFKLGSGDVNWMEPIEKMIKIGKPIIIATGASNLYDVDRVYEMFQDKDVDFSILQCNTNYTGASQNIHYSNLRVISTYKARYPNAIIGLSDHTSGDVAVLGAISLGAKIIEKHFTDDTSRTGPDHKFAMDPQAWNLMIERSRDLELALGDGIKKVEANEIESAIVQRRAVRYKRDLKKGHRITREDLMVLRPAPSMGIEPFRIPELIGMELLTDVNFDDLVKFTNFAH